jgi:N-acetyltransferase
MAASSSSPPRDSTIFSDENVPDDWTPPSSPNRSATKAIIERYKSMDEKTLRATAAEFQSRPALYTGKAAKQIAKAQKPQAKKSTQRHPLGSIKPTPKPKAAKSKSLTQMRLDLGQRIHTRCPTCGMEYRPSIAEDSKLHSKFHSQNVDGIPISHEFGLQLRILEDEEGLYKEEIILPIERRREKWAKVRKMVEGVLEVVETDLGGVGIGKEELWGSVREEGDESVEHDRYKTFLFLRKDQIVGVCLAERIFEAYPVLPPSSTSDSTNDTTTTTDAAITTSTQAQPATMGISRIWVSKCARGQGIANKLLRFAAKRFIYRVPLAREQIAFSQPTSSGAKLARHFFGKEGGWLVYTG